MMKRKRDKIAKDNNRKRKHVNNEYLIMKRQNKLFFPSQFI